jgi:hypothetical protein
MYVGSLGLAGPARFRQRDCGQHKQE